MARQRKVRKAARAAGRNEAREAVAGRHHYAQVNISQRVCRECGMLEYREGGATLFHRDTLRADGPCDGRWPFTWLPELRQVHGRRP